ncbi:MAG TPA: hypothetical protein VH370_00655 [Humisphaera sp.]|jgi:hypothetical protein|nr:hypothetical protein [Humisphaera sp.]
MTASYFKASAPERQVVCVLAAFAMGMALSQKSDAVLDRTIAGALGALLGKVITSHGTLVNGGYM